MFEVKRKYNLDTVNWDEAFLNYDESVKSNKQIKYNYHGFYVSHEAHEIEKVKHVLKNLDCTYAHLYFNITTEAETFGKHKDVIDVWFWQCRGITKWILNEKDEVTLYDGDLIYVSKGTYHNVIPLRPRLGISMSKE